MNFAKAMFEISTPIGKGITMCFYAELYSWAHLEILLVEKTTSNERAGTKLTTHGFILIPARKTYHACWSTENLPSAGKGKLATLVSVGFH